MARIRTIKPEFFTSLTIADLTPEQRLTFIGLWTHVDDEGRCVDDPRLVKAAVWPLDDRTAADVEGDLRAIHAKSLIIRYVAGGKRYMAVAGWGEHQKINRPTRSKLPSPADGTPTPPDSRSTHGGLTEPSREDAGTAQEGSQTTHAPPPSAETTTSRATDGPEPSQGQNDSPETCEDAPETESSASTHGALTEDSVQERNREQGTGNREKTPPPTAGPPKGAKTARGTRLPDDFPVTPEMAEWAQKNTPACGFADHDAFCDYWRSKPGKDGRKLDWVATWRNWMRREHERRTGGSRAAGGPASPRRSTTDERVAQAQALKNELGLTTDSPQLNLIRGELA